MIMLESPHVFLVDTGFWFALYKTKDQHHKKACEIESRLGFDKVKIIMPWPSLYETLNTQFIKNSEGLNSFTRLLRSPQVVRLSDCGYRERSLEIVLQSSSKRPLSLVDMVIRAMLDDENIVKHGLLSFNARDFSDLCWKNRIALFPDVSGN